MLAIIVLVIFPFVVGNQVKYKKNEFNKHNNKNEKS